MSRPKGVIEEEMSSTCEQCGATYDCQRPTSRFCGVTCRSINHRKQKVVVTLSAREQATERALDRVETWRL